MTVYRSKRAGRWKLGIFVALAIAFLLLRGRLFENDITMINNGALAQADPGWQTIRVLTANVGNVNLRLRKKYNNKLSEQKVEHAISRNIQELKPDIVFLQELMHPSQCDDWIETDKNKVCYQAGLNAETNQARRLLGNEYSILCSSRMRQEIGHPVGMECIAVHINAGTIQGCQPGELCQASEGLDIVGSKCNPEFVVMSANAQVRNVRIRLVNAHPHSRNIPCRDSALEQIFEGQSGIPALADGQYTIIAGDLNFDPFRAPENMPAVWQRHVGLFGSGKDFYYHSGLAEHSPPYPTVYFLLQKKTIDHVISNFARGVCTTLGEAPGTLRIDGGEGMDHRAVFCEMWIPPNDLGT